ncbi:MAG: hypothetical protein M3R69_15555 [Acidobacteriota bacterium]|nr:hypothetical protein [Acidobacteriota bacterium]
MAHRAARFLLFSILLSLMPAVAAQDTSDKTTSPPRPAASPAKATAKRKANSAASKARIEQQRALALSILVSLANDARSYPDQTLRARTLSRIADAFWEADPEQGRALFRRAWDAAGVADEEAMRRIEEDRKRQEADNGAFAMARPPDLRSEVLRLAAKRDRALGEELLDKMKEARKQEAAEATSPTRTDPFDTPASLKQRLRLANQLLDTDVGRALQFADPGLVTVTVDGLDFLSLLREKNPAGADQRYARLLRIAQTDLQSDANTVSLLSSYLFTPHLFVTFLRDGGQQSSRMNQRTPPPDVTPELRSAFFRTAAQILLRPSPSREQDRSSSGILGKYLVVKRLLPVFEQYAPKEVVEQLRGELASLRQGTDAGEHEDAESDEGVGQLQGTASPKRNAEDMEKALLDRIDRAKTSAERDAIYLQLAARTAEKGDMRARDFTDKIEDSELRKQVKPYVDMTLAMQVVEKKDTEKTLNIARNGELTHIQRVWVLTEAAGQMPPADREKALEIVGEAAAEARRIDGSDPDRPRALVAVANALMPLDRARAWEMMLEVTKASNSVEGFNGDDGRLMMRLQTKNMASMRTSTVDEFNLNGIFSSLSKDNATQAIQIARSFEREAPRATALIAVARALLSDKGN